MPTPLLATKLYIPRQRPQAVSRPRLAERLNEGLHCRLTLVSAPAGFGKTTLLSEWAARGERAIAWLSLDEGDSDPARFLTYLVAALQTIAAGIGKGVLAALQSPQPPPPASVLTTLLNEIAAIPNSFTLILMEVLRLIAQGLSNREIGARLFLALSTVKGHNWVIFDKLHVQSRTEALVRARELGLV